jgi:6-phosphofructokinase 1
MAGSAIDTAVRVLGPRARRSPLGLATAGGETPSYVPEGARVLEDVELGAPPGRTFERAGPREAVYFDPATARAGVVTAGGLCPGTNNVIRSIVLQLFHKYGVKTVLGYRYGFAGLDPASSGFEPVRLGPDEVRHIHLRGGTVLGSSRGERDPARMVETLVRHGVSMLFAIGGDGTMRAAHVIAEEALRRGAAIAVVGVPKTIDNDIPFVDKTYGFETAVSIARMAIDAAHTEALSAYNGVGLVRLMGREAGFLAANATVASQDVNACLVPEVRFELDGPSGVLAWLEGRLAERRHAVVVVAEGCGASLGRAARDASGNVRFTAPEVDIGAHVRSAIERHLDARRIEHALKYIDPGYIVRGVPANAMDAVFCDELARSAVHAAMAGRTDVMIGRRHRMFTHLPLPLVVSEKKRLDPAGELWLSVLEATGQPRFF